jgi:uncharacterized protein YndB with AHSA1/START domain/DNA-binding transcriptional ArsR family regulator
MAIMDAVLTAIAEPHRREILRLIQIKELSSGEIASHFTVTRPAISQHLRVLADAGLVSLHKEGTRRLYRARPEGMAELREFLEAFWTGRLNVLKAEAEAQEAQQDQEAQEEETMRPPRQVTPEAASQAGRETIPAERTIAEREVRIAARPDTIFPFLVDPAMMVRWMGVDVSLDPRPGGVYRVNINGRDVVSGHFVEVVPNSRVVFTWGWEGENVLVPPGASTVEITLSEDGDGTLLRLRHLNLPAAERDSHLLGWDHFLSRLVAVSEGRDPGSDAWATPAN